MQIKFDLNNFKLNYKQDLPQQFKNETGVIVADFEVSATDETKEAVFVYSSCYMNVNDPEDNCYHNFNVHDFMTNIKSLPYAQTVVAFHNLSYDIVPIISEYIYPHFKQITNRYIKSQNGTIKLKRGAKKIIHEIDNVIDKSTQKDIAPYTYQIIYANGQFYCLDLYLDEITVKVNGRNKKKLQHIRFIDTYKIVTQDLKKLASNFLGYEIAKDELDHTLIRSREYIPTDEEKRYLYNDVKVLKDLLKLIKIDGVTVKGDYKIKFDKMTTASQSLHEYKRLIFDDYTKGIENKDSEAFKYARETMTAQIEWSKERGRKFNADMNDYFQIIFPKTMLDIDSFNRGSYFGGITWVNEDLINSCKDNSIPLKGLIFDVNSMYPFTMRHKMLPFGKPQYFTNDYDHLEDRFKNEYPLYIQKIKVDEFELKPGKMPCIQVKNNEFFSATEYLKNNKAYNPFTKRVDYEPVLMTLTNVQLELILDSYNFPMGITYVEGYAFKGSYNLFDTYIDLFMTLKKSKNKTQRSLAKLLLNALYGKFGTNPAREERIIKIYDGVFTTENRDDDGNLLDYISDSIYLPLASFVTSYARELLVTTANAIGMDRVFYCDTDSLHILNYDIPDNIKIHESDLGAWKCEGMFTDSKYLGAKRYAEKVLINEEKEENLLPHEYDPNKIYPEEWEIKCCGVSSDTISKIDDINIFDICPHKGTEIRKLIEDKNLYTKKGDIYYYYDKQCTERVIGLLRSKKKQYVKGGIYIKEQPYAITPKIYILN